MYETCYWMIIMLCWELDVNHCPALPTAAPEPDINLCLPEQWITLQLAAETLPVRARPTQWPLSILSCKHGEFGSLQRVGNTCSMSRQIPWILLALSLPPRYFSMVTSSTADDHCWGCHREDIPRLGRTVQTNMKQRCSCFYHIQWKWSGRLGSASAE